MLMNRIFDNNQQVIEHLPKIVNEHFLSSKIK